MFDHFNNHFHHHHLAPRFASAQFSGSFFTRPFSRILTLTCPILSSKRWLHTKYFQFYFSFFSIFEAYIVVNHRLVFFWLGTSLMAATTFIWHVIYSFDRWCKVIYFNRLIVPSLQVSARVHLPLLDIIHILLCFLNLLALEILALVAFFLMNVD